MTTQPEALRLADECDEHMVDFADVANELRRLHEVNQELLEALKDLLHESDGCIHVWTYNKTKEAIAKAERTTK